MQDICQIGQAEAMPQSSGPGDEPITHLTYWAKPLALSSKAVGKTALARRNKCTSRYASGSRWVLTSSVDQLGAQMVGWQDEQASLGFLPPTNVAGHHHGTSAHRDRGKAGIRRGTGDGGREAGSSDSAPGFPAAPVCGGTNQEQKWTEDGDFC